MMMDYYVIIANSSTARFFYLEPVEIPEMESGPNLRDDGSMNNPEGELADRDVFTTLKSGRNRESAGGSRAGHGYDDHREEHRLNNEKKFAEEIGGQVSRKLADGERKKLVLVADPHMLGLLRPIFMDLRKQGVKVDEHTGDLVHLSAIEIQDKLADHQLLPRRHPPRASGLGLA